jgi:hypothetical protein
LKKAFVLISLCCLLAALLGCGGSNSTIVFISPSTATVKTGATLQFTANVPVSWSVTANAVIDSAGFFRAGNTTGNVTVTAIARDGSGSSSTAIVTISTTGTATTTTSSTPSGIKHRVFVSNKFSGVLNIVDADSDVLSLTHLVSLGVGSLPTFMLQTSDQTAEAVYDSSSNSFWLISNATEALVANRPLAGPLTTAASAAVIPGGNAIYAAVPTATLSTAPTVPGAVYRADFAAGGYLSVAIQGARFLSMDHNAVNMLVFSKDCDTVTLVNSSTGFLTSNTGTLTSTVLPSGTASCGATTSFSRPVAAVFSADDSTAYVLSSGPVNGGTQPMVTVLDMTQKPPAVVKTLNVGGANVGLLQGTKLYVAGAATQACSSDATQTCQQGVLTVIGTITNTVTNSVAFGQDAPSLMPGVLTFDGTNLWIGSTGCQVSAGAPSCLSMYLPASGQVLTNSVPCVTGSGSTCTVLTPPTGDDVTGMVWLQPLNGRNIMYVIEGGELLLYDNTFANVVVQGSSTNVVVDIIGQAVDIKAAK